MNSRRIFLAVFSLMTLAACGHAPHPVEPPPVRAVGGERDMHGCLGAAGYVWCGREAACVRPWELAAARGFDAGGEAFRRYCSAGQ